MRRSIAIRMKRNDKLKVTLIGSYPPPYGGVSVHIQRLQTLLLNTGIQGIVYEYERCQHLKKNENVINIRKIKNWRHILNPTGSIIHTHNSGINLMVIILLSLLSKLRRKKLLMTFHSLRDDVEHFNWLKKSVTKVFLRCASYYIAVSPQIKKKLLSLDVNPERISVIPAFLPPAIKQRDINDVPQEIWDFINNHSPIISANAYRISFYNDQDLYGIDMCIDLCAKMKQSHPKIGFVFSLPDIGDDKYFEKLRQRIKEKQLEENFMFQTKACQFYPILMRSNIFVRPTNTDGYAVSIAEAIYFKVPAVVSNIVPRPEGTILFKNRDISDFTLKIKDVLDNYGWHKKRLEAVKLEDNFEKLMEVYQQLNGCTTGKEL